MTSKPRRRVLPIIDARFQWKYTAIFAGLSTGIAAVFGGMLYRANETKTKLLDLAGSELLRAEIAHEDRAFLWLLAGFVAVIAVLLIAWGLVLTHRISGPLHMVQVYLRKIIDGVLPEVRPLRRNDELQGLFVVLQQTVDGLRAHASRLAIELEHAIVALDGQGAHAELSQRLRGEKARLDRALDQGTEPAAGE